MTNQLNKPVVDGGDSLDHILGHCMCYGDMGCWYERTWQSLDNGSNDYDEIIRLMEPLEKAAITQLIVAREQEARKTAKRENAHDFDSIVEAFNLALGSGFDAPDIQRLRMVINSADARAKFADLPKQLNNQKSPILKKEDSKEQV